MMGDVEVDSLKAVMDVSRLNCFTAASNRSFIALAGQRVWNGQFDFCCLSRNFGNLRPVQRVSWPDAFESTSERHR